MQSQSSAIGAFFMHVIECQLIKYMKRFFSYLFVLITLPFLAQAQNVNNHNVSGVIIDGENGEPLPIAAVQILALPDSSQAKGVVTDMDGAFSATSVKNGKYVIRVSYIGYKTSDTPLEITGKSARNIVLEDIELFSDANLLAETTITAEVPKVQAVKDTIMFNSAAYRLSEGASVQELIKKLPGVDVDSDGNITVNGKAVTQILINGKEYLGDDITTLLENLPANVIDRLKTYEKKSDLARITGIDDGEEQTVFDLQTKEEMKGGLLNTYDVAYGSDYGEHNLYNGQIMANRFTDHNQFTLYASASNVIDQGIGNGGRQWGGNYGQNTYQDLSASYSYENEKLEVNGNVSVGHRANDYNTRSNSEYFYGATSTFSNSFSRNTDNSDRFRTNFYIEWKPDTMTNIIIRPYFNTSKSGSNSESASATFNSNPYDFMDDPLYDMEEDEYRAKYDSIFVNRNTGRSTSNSDNMSGGGSLQFNRRLNDEGRNITIRLSGDFNRGNSESYSYNTTEYYVWDSLNVRNRFTYTPSNRYGYSAQAMYSEPLFDKAFLQLSYRFNYNWNENDRQTYAFDDMGYGFMEKPDNYRVYMDSTLSKYASYTTFRHDAQISFRINREKFRLNTGIRLQPQQTRLEYTQKEHYSLTKNVFNWNPTFDFRYMFTEHTEMRFRVNGSSSQPSMTNLLPITDNSNPLYITQGNPNLKPSFTFNTQFNFHTFNVDKESSFMTNISYRRTNNSISNRVEYNEVTGGSTTRPENIDGNWNTSGMIGGNFALPDRRFTFNLFTNLSYSNQVGFLYQNNETYKAVTKSLSPRQNIQASFRDENFELTLFGNASLNHSTNDVRNSVIDNWNFNFGAYGVVVFPWDIRLMYDVFNTSRRGYDDDTYNTDELIINAELSKAFLKNKSAIISVQAFDLLGQRKNYSQWVGATSRSESEYNSINQYFMVHFVYKLNIFNGKLVQEDEEEDDRRPGGYGRHGGNRYRR